MPGADIVGEIRNDAGVRQFLDQVGHLADAGQRADQFRSFLEDACLRLGRWTDELAGPMPVLVSGMASSSVGWKELPYAETPFQLDGRTTVIERMDPGSTKAPNLQMWLISGVRTQTEMMRGEECQILGLSTRHDCIRSSEESCVVILPGTHSKHVWIEDGAVSDMRTFMTGELADLLARKSLLSVSVDWPPGPLPPTGDFQDTFRDGVQTVVAQGLSGSLFQVRTRSVLARADRATNAWFLSGMLIGSELMELARSAPGARKVLAAPDSLSAAYQVAWSVVAPQEPVTVIASAEVESAVVQGHRLVLERMMEKGMMR